MTQYEKDSTVVFVHGAWADGSSWSKLVEPLEQAGLRVVCAPLPLTSLTADTAAVEAVIDRVEGPVVLVGHAYAGAVIGAVKRKQVRALVFVAALAPDESETVADVFNRDPKHADSPAIAPDANGWIWMPHEGFDKAFAQHASAHERAISEAVQRPISVACIMQPVGAVAWKRTPSWYLVAEHDRMINPDTQRFMAKRMGAQIYEYAVDHTPSISAPDTVLHVVVNAARETIAVPTP